MHHHTRVVYLTSLSHELRYRDRRPRKGGGGWYAFVTLLRDAAAWPIQGLIRHFRPELERRIEEHNAQFAPDALEAAE